MAKQSEIKYGPKPRTKNRDMTAKRYVTRKATFGDPTGIRAPRAAYAPKSGAGVFRPSDKGGTSTYKPRAGAVPTRPSSTGYIKRAFTPGGTVTAPTERKPYVRPAPQGGAPGTHFAKAGFSGKAARPSFAPAFKKSTSWSKSKMEKGKFAKKRTPYVPRGVASASPMSRRRLDIGEGGKRVYSKTSNDGAMRPRNKEVRHLPESRKTNFKSKVPNRPRTASASWGAVASWYDKHLNEADTYHEKVILPNLIRLVDAEAGDDILDLACGQGFFTRAMKKTGASVTGIDIAPELITIAKAESEDIPYHVASAEKLTMFDNESFNKALISLSIQNIEHIENVVKEAARVLRPSGVLHIVMNHPAFRIPKRSSWGYDDQKKVQYRRVDEYLSVSKSDIDMHPGFADAPQTISFHRPLQFYFKAFTKAGFAVTRLEEWISHKASDSGPRASAENNARKEIPLFLYLQATKL